MDKNKIIIIALIVIIIALLVGIFSVMPNMNKQASDLTFKSKSTLTEGDSLKIKLTDVNGTALSNQSINITITDDDMASDYHSVITDEKGVGKLKLDKSPGKYDVTIAYWGNDYYKGCNANKTITIKKEVIKAEQTSSSTAASNDDPGAFYSRQAGRVIHTGEILDSPGGKHRHLGYNQWEPV